MRGVKRSRSWRLPLGFLLLAGAAEGQESALGLGLDEVPFHALELRDGFWKQRVHALVRRSLPALLDECERAGLLANFDIAAGLRAGEHAGGASADALVYQLLEASAYALQAVPDAKLSARVAEIVERIVAAQQEDGALSSYVTVAGSGRPWRDLEQGRELYCAAHLFEAAIALADAGLDQRLLAAAVRLADAICERFGADDPRRPFAPPGFPAIELGLMQLYRHTGEFRYQETAQRFVEGRGQPGRRKLYGEFAHDQTPLLETRNAAGHALRGLLLYSGLTNLVRATGYEDQYTTALTLYQDVQRRRSSLLGAVGTAEASGPDAKGMLGNGAFGPDHAWLCAGQGGEARTSAAFARWSREMFLLTAHAMYPSAYERALYNGLLGAIAPELDGFLDTVPMSSAGAERRTGGLATLETAADLCRAVAGIGRGAFARKGKGRDLYINAYLPCSTTLELEQGEVRVTLDTGYPLTGDVSIRFDAEWSRDVALHVLVPAWCEGGITLGVNEPIQTVTVEHGPDRGTWLVFQRSWEPGDRFLMTIPMEPRRVYLPEEVEGGRGQVALARGPLIYCFEACDQSVALASVHLPPDAPLRAEWRADLLGGVHVIRASGLALTRREGKDVPVPVELTAIPYHAWGNREAGEMRVLLPESAAHCTPVEEE